MTGGAHSGGLHSNMTAVITKKGIRRLTPTECERLMGWPDLWTKYSIDENGNEAELSDSQRYKLIGNGVVPQVVNEIVKYLILDIIDKEVS